MKQFEKLIYVNSRNEQLIFAPVGSKYHVNVQKDVTGLSDLTDTIYSSSSMGQHGDTFTGVRIEPRTIKITGKLKEPNKTSYIQLRQKAEKILNPELAGTLFYSYGTFTRKIGAIVDNAPVFMHPDTSQEFEIDFLCLDPFWQEETEAKEDIASWIGDWEFPCEIDHETGMEFGHREESVIVDIYNGGHVSTGMRIKFSALGELTNPSLFNVNTREFIKVNYDMKAGDQVVIDTSYGRKTVILIHNGTKTNIYRYIDVDSTFVQLDIGDNLFRYDADTGLDNLECTVYYSEKYLGV